MNEPEPIASTFISKFNDIPETLSNNINKRAILFESCQNDKIQESETFTNGLKNAFAQTSALEITKVIHKLKNSNSVTWDQHN